MPFALLFSIVDIWITKNYRGSYTLVSDKAVRFYVNNENEKNITMDKVQRVVLFFVKRWNRVDTERYIVFDDGTFECWDDAYTLVHKSEEYSWIMIGYSRKAVDKLKNRFPNLKFEKFWSEYTKNNDF